MSKYSLLIDVLIPLVTLVIAAVVSLGTSAITIFFSFRIGLRLIKTTEWYRRLSSWEPLAQQVHAKRIDVFCELIQRMVESKNSCLRLASKPNKDEAQLLEDAKDARLAVIETRGKALLLMKKPLIVALSEFITTARSSEQAVIAKAHSDQRSQFAREIKIRLHEFIGQARKELDIERLDDQTKARLTNIDAANET